MLNNIKVNLNALEYMIFFWQSVMDREKVSEFYLTDVAKLPEMAVLYDDEFTEESVRLVLSAITNKELLNTAVVKERQFWNNNMWVTEDSELLNLMMTPIKSLNLDGLKDEINKEAEVPYEEVEINFIPGLKEDAYITDNKITVNFFKVMVDLFGGTGEVTICGLAPAEYIKGKILELDGVTMK